MGKPGASQKYLGLRCRFCASAELFAESSVRDQYTYLDVVFLKSSMLLAGLHLWARQLFLQCVSAGQTCVVKMFLTISSLVQHALSDCCEAWGLEGPSICSPILTERALHVRKSVPDDVCLCELGRSQFCKVPRQQNTFQQSVQTVAL